MKNQFDIAIIGSGPGGYVAALSAAHMNKSVCLIEKGQIGGTCLNRGCIPTKAYAASRDLLHNVRSAGDFGIDISSFSVDFKKIFERKNEVVKNVRKSVSALLKGNGVTLLKGHGELKSPNTIVVTEKECDETLISADNIIIATGSKPLAIPLFKIDHQKILSSNDILKLETLPKSLIIIGGGIIGCEFASIFSSFGVEVTIVELLENILPTVDAQISNIIRRRFKVDGINIIAGTKVLDVSLNDNNVDLTLSDGKVISAEKVLVSVGRASNTSGIGLEAVGITLERGRIPVDDDCRTSIPHIFAIGDVTPGAMLAHKASYDAIRAVKSAFGMKLKPRTDNIPSVVFTLPEIAYAGIDERTAKEKSIDYTCGRFSYASSSKAVCAGETTGLIKVIAKKESGVIIGASICGAHAADMIYGLSVAIDKGLKAQDIYETIFAHPTISEGVKEALEDIDGFAVHKISVESQSGKGRVS